MLSKLGVYAIVVGFMYLFLAFCSWSFDPMVWNGFSRVLLGAFGIILIVLFLDDIRN